METLITLNLNGLTPVEESKRAKFYESLESRWKRVRGSTIDTAWTITWTHEPTHDSADARVKLRLEEASVASGIPLRKVAARWAHDPTRVGAFP